MVVYYKRHKPRVYTIGRKEFRAENPHDRELEDAVEKILLESQGFTLARRSHAQQHICRVRSTWKTELLTTINDAINGLYPMQEIRVCCGGQERAKRAAEIMSKPLKKRKIMMDANDVDIESDDDEDTGDYMINIDMNGTWTITDYHTGEIKENDKCMKHQVRWKMLAFVLYERERAWPRLARLQWQVAKQRERGEDGMTKEAMREIYETENYYDKMRYECGDTDNGNETVREMNKTDGDNSSRYTPVLRNTAPPYYGYEETPTVTPAADSDTMKTM